MQRDGFEVVRGVLSEEEVKDFLRCIEKDYNTKPHVSHSYAVWKLRTHERVQAPFKRIYGTDSLCVGFDGVCLPNQGEGFTLGWHVDQNASHDSSKLQNVQSIIALTPHDESTGGLQLKRGSHVKHADLTKGDVSRGWEFVEVEEEDVEEFDTVQPTLKRGDMCLWDSRLVHRVVLPTIQGGRGRGVAYMSFEPASNLTTSMRRRRMIAFKKGISTTHWASRLVDREEERSPPDFQPNEEMLLLI